MTAGGGTGGARGGSSAPGFVLVGGAAAAVHWGVVVALVGRPGWPPLAANIAGWVAAFGVSFAGHHRISFAGHGTPLATSARRFALVSAGGFAVNEAAYAALLSLGGARYDLALLLVLATVALLTYLLSRRWAFLRTG